MSTENPKRILDDLAKELDGECLEETFTWKGRKIKIKLGIMPDPEAIAAAAKAAAEAAKAGGITPEPAARKAV